MAPVHMEIQYFLFGVRVLRPATAVIEKDALTVPNEIFLEQVKMKHFTVNWNYLKVDYNNVVDEL